MTPALAPVPTKDSGIEWVRAIPAHWNVLPFYSCADEVATPNVGLRERNLLSLSYGRIVRKDMERLKGLVPASFEGYNIIEANDIVFRLTDLQNDQTSLRSARATERGIITSAYISVRPRVNSRFFNYLMRAYDTAKVFYAIGGGIRQSMKFTDLKRIPIVVPPDNEMERVANYLDRETARIDTLVAKKTRFIELLREKRQALITHAVTKGLDPNAPMKDSGVEWFAKIPVGWKLTRLRFVASIRNSNVDKKLYDGQKPILLCNYTDVYYNERITSDDGLMKATASESEIENFELKAGDVIITKDSESPDDIGIPALVVKDLPGVVCGYHLTQLRTCSVIFPEYLLRVLQATNTRKYLEVETPGVTRYGLDQDTIGSIPIGLPPKHVQQDIIEHLDNASTRIDSLIAKTERSIELLREHRTALITAAVTGKIDLRDAA